MHQIRNIKVQKGIDGFRKFLEDLMLDHQFLGHEKVQDPNKPSAK